MNYVEELIGDIPVNGVTVGFLLLVIAACVFLYKTYKKFKNMIIDNYKASAERDKKIDDTFDEVKKYHEFRVHDREQSLQIQAELTASIKAMEKTQTQNSEHLVELEKKIVSYELSITRDRLIHNYRYFTSPKTNPSQAWTELEKEAFFELFKTYEERGGDGYMHDTVQPAMLLLTVIPMSDHEAIIELMHTRN